MYYIHLKPILLTNHTLPLEVASAAPNTPMVYYHYAEKTGVSFHIADLIEFGFQYITYYILFGVVINVVTDNPVK